eukprot:gnl/MRDRNA2_/MRDRNA2_34264_c0_seq2.p1 gnl/MRDRNA2_/MRDRNA2_34264_c0~~gnl/MRDRNA2_/MRDRNA2_34264_c0_seq2.p1  ORF type:complete len:465 (-),score=69.76 gnl/MRDRNA2_/MRDRNA2_34264_c0_seq2:11-1405(-)
MQTSMKDTDYDVLVVGRGMVGSAAARHLAKNGVKVVLVGPPERPRSEWHSLEIFGACYDEGRITRKTDPDPTWAALASASIDRYAEIEKEGGERFFFEVGHLAVGPSNSQDLSARAENASQMGVQHEYLNECQLQARFPYICFPLGSAAILEPKSAGHISARKLVSAQVKAALRHGGDQIQQEVSKIEIAPGGGYAVHLASGEILRVPKVLVAAGAFCNSRPLLPAGESGANVELALDVTTTQTVHFVLGTEDIKRLQGMPSVIYKGPDFWCYILPPIEYPDGTVRLKLGGARMSAAASTKLSSNSTAQELLKMELANREKLNTKEDVTNWYRSAGDPNWKQVMIDMMNQLFPGLQPLDILSDACASDKTPSSQPYVGLLREGLCVASGGNGYAAKSSDELGRLAACAVLSKDGWGAGEALCKDTFQPILKASQTQPQTSLPTKSKQRISKKMSPHFARKGQKR